MNGVGSISAYKIRIAKKTLILWTWYAWRRKVHHNFSPHILTSWCKREFYFLLSLYMTHRPLVLSQGLLWGIMKFPPRNMICQWQLKFQVTVCCLVLVQLSLFWSSGWHLNSIWLFLKQPCWYQTFGQDLSSYLVRVTQAWHISREEKGISCPLSDFCLCICWTFCLEFFIQPI